MTARSVRSSNSVQARACAPMFKEQQSRIAFQDTPKTNLQAERACISYGVTDVLHDAAASLQALTR